MQTNRACLALAERRMCRFLWKIIQFPDGCRLVPTRRLTAALLLASRVGFPRVLFEPIQQMIAHGAKLANRIPFEAPRHFFGSFYGLEAGLSVSPCQVLRGQGLLELYDDRFGDPNLVTALGLSATELQADFLGRVGGDIDVMDKMRGDPVESRVQVPSLARQLSAVLDAALQVDGYPITCHPHAAEAALRKLGRPAHVVVALERQLLEALPPHAVCFSDLPALAHSRAAQTLRTITGRILAGDSAAADPAAWTEPLRLARAEVECVGTTYAALALGTASLPADDPALPDVAGCDPAAEVEGWLLRDPAVRLHRSVCASRCASGSNDIDLLMIYSSWLWLESTNLGEMARMLGGFAPAQHDVICGRAAIH